MPVSDDASNSPRLHQRFTLDGLLAAMAPEHQHDLEDDGPAGSKIV